MKRIIAIILVMCTVLVFGACGGGSSAEEAVKKAGWEKNKNVAFLDYLEHVITTRYNQKELYPEVEIYYTIKMSQDKIASNGKNNLPVTYTVAIDGTETYEYDMVYKDGALTVAGGKNISQNQPYEIEVIEEMLNAHLQDKIK